MSLKMTRHTFNTCLGVKNIDLTIHYCDIYRKKYIADIGTLQSELWAK